MLEEGRDGGTKRGWLRRYGGRHNDNGYCTSVILYVSPFTVRPKLPPRARMVLIASWLGPSCGLVGSTSSNYLMTLLDKYPGPPCYMVWIFTLVVVGRVPGASLLHGLDHHGPRAVLRALLLDVVLCLGEVPHARGPPMFLFGLGEVPSARGPQSTFGHRPDRGRGPPSRTLRSPSSPPSPQTRSRRSIWAG